MTKTFFIVIPYSRTSISAKKSSPFSKFFPSKKDSAEVSEAKKDKEIEAFEEIKSQLGQRANVIKQGLARTGIRTTQLGTEEVTELYYKFLNPGEDEKPIKVS